LIYINIYLQKSIYRNLSKSTPLYWFMETISNKKLCKLCGLEKGFTEFYKNTSFKDGLLNICKECKKSKKKQTYLLKSEKVKKGKENVIIAHQYQLLLEECCKKISICLDLDERMKLIKEFHQIGLESCAKMGELSLTSVFNIPNKDQDDFLIYSRVQEYILTVKKDMIVPDEIIIERSTRFIIISLPDRIKLTKEDVSTIAKLLS
jgi:hypothetical protein